MKTSKTDSTKADKNSSKKVSSKTQKRGKIVLGGIGTQVEALETDRRCKAEIDKRLSRIQTINYGVRKNVVDWDDPDGLFTPYSQLEHSLGLAETLIKECRTLLAELKTVAPDNQ